MIIEHTSTKERIKSYKQFDSPLTKKDFQTAIDIQSACNLGAVIHAFNAVITKLQAYAHLHNKGTDWINNHPIVRMYAEQISHLSREMQYHTAHDICDNIVDP